MTLIYITVVVGVLGAILYLLTCISAAHKFKTKYPNMVLEESHWSSRMLAVIQMSIVLFIPLFNIVFVYVLIFKSDEIIEKGVSKMYAKAKEVKV